LTKAIASLEFTERDVLLRLSLGEHDQGKISVREVMTTPVEMATRATAASEALAATVERATTGTGRP
jgi:CBS domain-containing protein